MEKTNIFILLIAIIASCYGTYLPEYNGIKSQNDQENSQNIKIYDYGTPSNLQELYEIQNGNLIPMAKIKYINYKQPSNFVKIEGKAITSQKAFNFNIKTEKSAESEIYEKALLRAEETISNAIG